MSNARGYDKGYTDYQKDKPCLVRRDVRGRLQWASDYGDLEEPEVWAGGYIAGYTQACKDDDGYDVPMNPKERLRG